MHTEPRSNARTRCALGAALTGVLVVLVPASPTVAAPDPDAESGAGNAPQLSITVDNDREEVDEGDTLSYEITVENLGTDEVADLQVSQTLPTGLAFASADEHGAADHDAVRWTVDIGAGDHATLRSKLKVTTPPDDALRLATVACASKSALDPPIVCASHLAALPAAEEADRAKSPRRSSSWSHNDLRRPMTFGVVALAVGLLATLTLRRRRRGRAASL